MPVDYSKWDALELSDDSDIEVHPNVDKRSFIRAKQNQIHQQRYERRHQIETLKYERIINDGLLQRIDTLLAALRSHGAQAKHPDEFIMQALVEIAGDPRGDDPPKPPEGVHSKSEQPHYSQMMASLVDQVKQKHGTQAADDWSQSYVAGVEEHQKKIQDLQKELIQKLGDLEAEEGRKITSDSIHTGFNKSFMSKDTPKPKPAANPKVEKTVEVLNPGTLQQDFSRQDGVQSPGADADVDEPLKSTQDVDEEELAELSDLSRAFATIKPGDYNACRRFIAENRDVVTERETDALLVEAFNALTDGKNDYGKQCIHQGLLLQYCRSLGKDGVDIFFKRCALIHPHPFTLCRYDAV
jgi:cell division cycle protein 37